MADDNAEESFVEHSFGLLWKNWHPNHLICHFGIRAVLEWEFKWGNREETLHQVKLTQIAVRGTQLPVINFTALALPYKLPVIIYHTPKGVKNMFLIMMMDWVFFIIFSSDGCMFASQWAFLSHLFHWLTYFHWLCFYIQKTDPE